MLVKVGVGGRLVGVGVYETVNVGEGSKAVGVYVIVGGTMGVDVKTSRCSVDEGNDVSITPAWLGTGE